MFSVLNKLTSNWFKLSYLLVLLFLLMISILWIVFVSITVLAYVPFQGNCSLIEADVVESCKQRGIQSFTELVANCIYQEKCMSEKNIL